MSLLNGKHENPAYQMLLFAVLAFRSVCFFVLFDFIKYFFVATNELIQCAQVKKKNRNNNQLHCLKSYKSLRY